MKETQGRPTKSVEIAFAGEEGVIANVLRKKALLELGDPRHQEIKTALVCPGGGQRGVVQGGMGIGLQKHDIFKAFDDFVGVSAGVAVGYYGLVRQVEIGTSIYYEDNVQNQFVNLWRLRKIMDIDTLEKVFRTVKPIDYNTLRSSRTNFWIGVTDAKTGEGKFIDAKFLEDPLTAFIASICVPFFSGGKTVNLNGKEYLDGNVSNPLPVTYAIEQLGATDILVLLTSPLRPKTDNRLLGIVLDKTVYRTLSPKLRESMATYVRRYNEELKYLTGEKPLPRGVHLAAIYPKVMPITEFTMDAKLLEEGARIAAAFTEILFKH